MAMDLKKMNVVNLYLTTCRYVLQAEEEYVSELYGLLSYLRQALSCCVCGQLLRQPLGPKPNVCQHFVCKDCIGSKMKLKPSCSWCKDSSEFVENTQISILVHCFKKLCEYLYSSRFVRDQMIQSNGETNGLVLLVQEAIAFDENYPSTIEGKLSVLPCMELLYSKKKETPGNNKQQNPTTKNISQLQQPPTLPSHINVLSSPVVGTPLSLFTNKREISYTTNENLELEPALFPRTTTTTSTTNDPESRNGCSSSPVNNNTNIRNDQQNPPQVKYTLTVPRKRKRSLWNSRGELTCLEPGHRDDDDDDDDDQEQNSVIKIQNHNNPPVVSPLKLFSNVEIIDSSPLCKKLKLGVKEK